MRRMGSYDDLRAVRDAWDRDVQVEHTVASRASSFQIVARKAGKTDIWFGFGVRSIVSGYLHSTLYSHTQRRNYSTERSPNFSCRGCQWKPN